MKIGNVEIAGLTALAPMAGVADTAFRTVCRSYGASYVVGEMVSAKGLCMENGKTCSLLDVTGEERPMAVQLFGSEPDVMAAAAKLAMRSAPEIIDINMGCPAPKVTSGGSGSALMRDPALAGRIIAAVASAVDIPVTVKIRKGWDDDSVNAVELARIAEENGAAAVTVHGRTRAQRYMPPADWEIIARVKETLKIPVIGNGDVDSPQAARRMIDETGCDLVMIGRAALGAPWLFRRTEEYLRTDRLPDEPTLAERMEVMRRHLELLCRTKGENVGMREARKHAVWYMRGLRGAAALRAQAGRLNQKADIDLLAEEALKQNPEL